MQRVGPHLPVTRRRISPPLSCWVKFWVGITLATFLGCSESGSKDIPDIDPHDPLVLLDWYDGPDHWVEFLDLVLSPDNQTAYLCSNIRGIVAVDISDPMNLRARWCNGNVSGQPTDKPFIYQSACEHLAIAEKASDGSTLPEGSLLVTHRGHIYMPNAYLAWVETPDVPADPTQEASLTLIDYVYEPGVRFHGLSISDGNVVVATGQEGIRTYALGTKSLDLLGIGHGANNAVDVETKGTIAYVADGGYGIRIFDIEDMTNPTPLGSLALDGTSQRIAWAHDDLLLVAGGTSGLHLVDVSEPAAPKHISTLQTGGVVADMVAHQDTVYMAAWSELLFADISNPEHPKLLGGEKGRSSGAFPRFLTLAHSGSNLFAAEWNLLESFLRQEEVTAPDVRIQPLEMLFESKLPSHTSSLRIENIGTASLHITVTDPLPANCSTSVTEIALAPSETTFMEITCSDLPEAFEATLHLLSNDPDSLESTVLIRTGDDGSTVGDLFPSTTFENPLDGSLIESESLFMGKVTAVMFFASL